MKRTGVFALGILVLAGCSGPLGPSGATPNARIEAAITNLEAVRADILGGAPGVGDVEDAVSNLNEAIVFLQVSLARFRPGDPTRLRVAMGEAFFGNIEDAVEEIFDVIDSGAIRNLAILSDLQSIVVHRILVATQVIAETAIEDAVAAGGVAEDLADAQAEFAKAKGEVGAGVAAGITALAFFDDAVGSFEDAWINAQRAVGALSDR